jgi:hypothetical protein
VTLDSTAALFVMLGKTAERAIDNVESVVPPGSLMLAPEYDLAPVMPAQFKEALKAAETYKLFFLFEGYLRELVLDVLSKNPAVSWWDRVPPDVQTEVVKLEETEESKVWMALGSRDKMQLLTYPQLLRTIDVNWKEGFNDLVRDKALIGQARLIGHLRNAICHMTAIPEAETERVRTVMRDWFRVVAP